MKLLFTHIMYRHTLALAVYNIIHIPTQMLQIISTLFSDEKH